MQFSCMTDESTQDDQIREMTLRNQMNGYHFTAFSIFCGLGVFIVTLSGGLKRIILLAGTIAILAFLLYSYQAQLKKIDAIFKK
jgi:hypothetical protein